MRALRTNPLASCSCLAYGPSQTDFCWPSCIVTFAFVVFAHREKWFPPLLYCYAVQVSCNDTATTGITNGPYIIKVNVIFGSHY